VIISDETDGAAPIAPVAKPAVKKAKAV
jgi:hypothetical protein